MENVKEDLQEIKKGISEIKQQLNMLQVSSVSEDWIPRKLVMRFFSYADTQMAALERSGLVVTKVGKRKFVQRASLQKLLKECIL